MNILAYNELKKQELIEKIKKCGNNYKIFFLDVDDVIYNIEPVMQQILEGIDYRATKKFLAESANETSAEEYANISRIYFGIKNAILEETLYEEFDERREAWIKRNYSKIDYNDVFQDYNLFPHVIENINKMMENRGENVFFVACSHRNPTREAEIKTKKLYDNLPNLDLVLTLTFHIAPGSKEINSKASYVMKELGLPNLNNCYLIDNSKTNCDDWRQKGGTDIKFLNEGFESYHTFADHISKIISLDPYMIQFAISYIEYAKLHPEIVQELDIPVSEYVKKIKR